MRGLDRGFVGMALIGMSAVLVLLQPAAGQVKPRTRPADDIRAADRAAAQTAEEAWTESAGRRPADLPDGFMIIEEDIIVPTNFFGGPGPASTHITSGLWPGGIVPYEFSFNVTAQNQQRALDAMAEWEAVANVLFVPLTNQANYIFIQESNSNSSFVGMVGGSQPINIFNWTFKYIICHELAHAMGFWHEQSRPDRNTYIQVNEGNITPSTLGNFSLIGSAATEGGYDFDSIMHYGQCAFANCSCPSSCTAITVLPPNQSWQNLIGQRNHMSVLDAAGMAAVYGTPDCNGNGVFDACDLDCAAGNGACNVAGCGQSTDCNANGVLDDCEGDCNGNGVPDDCDLASAASADCNGNAIPDECDVAGATSPDCQNNDVPDECDNATNPTGDCNGPASNCFIVHAQPGCDNAVVQACACGVDASCCGGNWDAFCVLFANACAPCGAGVAGNGVPDECEVPCTGPGDCNDGNACTSDSCGGDGFCDFTPANNPATTCCNPSSGVLTPVEDGSVCTIGNCESSTGQVTQTPVPDGPTDGCGGGDPCNDGACEAGSCSLVPISYGDVNRDAAVDIFDILCVLDGFAGTFTSCPFNNVNIAPCMPDGVIDIFDILAELDAFAGTNTCCP
ncbi:MAG: hypothetical protein HOP29_15500 [Phycisphaerales bacterium]|nr:hypothetical protein [Phycisphaerales bacterium]